VFFVDAKAGLDAVVQSNGGWRDGRFDGSVRNFVGFRFDFGVAMR